MASILTLYPPEKRQLSGIVELPVSKSLLNRKLIIHALSGEQLPEIAGTLPEDVHYLYEALKNPGKTVWCGDGGTTLRFLLAYFCIAGKAVTLDGSNRLKQRPLQHLTDALEQMGFQFKMKDSKPPIEVLPANNLPKCNHIRMDASISSQFLSAIAMIAPYYPGGLTIELTGEVVSKPYLEMTFSVMKEYGIEVRKQGDQILIPEGSYQSKPLEFESDWSAASYWFALASLSDKSDLLLKNLQAGSLQGDKVMIDYTGFMGLEVSPCDEGLQISCSKHSDAVPESMDFSEHPDLMMTFAMWMAAKQLKTKFTGLQTLKYKESDRVVAMQTELEKFGWNPAAGKFDFHAPFDVINTHHDHRIAMAVAPAALFFPVKFENPEVVNKSYPGFWDELKKVGFKIALK